MEEKILIIGSTGMLGQALCKALSNKHIKHWGIARHQADFCVDITHIEAIEKIIDQLKPTIIVNSAALINLAVCETNPLLAYHINARAAGQLALLCQHKNIYFMQISTDHYYDNEMDKIHDEAYPVLLVNEYARTKYVGEILVLQNKASLVIRTNLVGYRNWSTLTFVENILNQLANKQSINLFHDYYTSAIDVYCFANILIDLMRIKPYGIYNISSKQVISKKEFIIALAKKFQLHLNNPIDVSVNSSLDIKRATSLGLDVTKAEKLLNYDMPTSSEVINNLFLHREIANV